MSPSAPSEPTDTADRSYSYLDHLERGVDAVSRAPSLALVTLLTALLGVDRFDDVLASNEMLSVTLGLPSPTPDLWSFLNTTGQVSVTDGVVRAFGPEGAALLVVGTVIRAVLGAGILGVLAGLVGGGDRPSFATAARRYFVPVFLFEAAVALWALLLALLALASGGSVGLVLVGILVGLAVLYVAYGTPFIAVTHDYGFRRALDRSVSLSTTGPYVGFTVGYALTVLVCSPFVSALAYADGVPGVLLAAVVAAPVGAVLAGAATSFFASVAE
ncbi:hypothetical protein HUG10_01210 [Halorarum halophilum]|uniref:Uncharacterized protein n=1 Tax=Halorarum halophilum TaxID=2743090 RepID=A0A7D5JZW5_9EURY|nr:hypothetical protein [Halobaculum halophilum]QLG26241.1 hypothetical protein HUG10_01210 [Halobaculum halophilum]